jgi:hypothetical protein
MGHASVCSALLVTTFVAFIGCGGGGERPRTAPDGESRLSELRYRVASDPRDLSARRALGHELVAVGLPGEAMKHFGLLATNRALRPRDRERHVALLIERASARVALGDADAYLDLESAQRISSKALPKEQRTLSIETQALAALGGLRYADKEGRERAAKHLTQLAELAPTDPRLAVQNPDTADLSALAIAAAWAFDGGALRVALELYEAYVARDGRQREHLERWLAAHRWWYGTNRSPSVLVIRALTAAGGQTCSIADDLADYGCEEQIAQIAQDAALAPKLLTRARERFWETTQPTAAAGWVMATLGAWLRGESSDWLDLINERVDVSGLMRLHGIEDIPRAAAPTLLRAAGRTEDSAVALDVALERFAELSPKQRALVIAEAALQGRSPEALQQLATAHPTAAAGWWMAARAARVAEDLQREREIVSVMPSGVADDYHAVSNDWGALSDSQPFAHRAHQRSLDLLGARHGTAAHGSTHLFRVPDPNHLSSTLDPELVSGLGAIAATYTESPAVADRLAAELVDRRVAVAERGLLVAELFARLGDPVRSRQWAHRVLESSPGDPRYRMVAAAAESATGDPTRADVLFIRAAATSGNAGAVNTIAAKTYLANGQPLHAIIAGRRALQLTAPGEDLAVLLVLAEAMQALARESDREATLQQYLERIAEPNRERARAGLDSTSTKQVPSAPDAIEAAAAWSPANAAAQLALSRVAAANKKAVRQLALIAVGPGYQALPALDALSSQL